MKKETLPRLALFALMVHSWALAPPVQAGARTISVSILDAANRGFRDQVAGDGKGGWTDQGPDNDLATLRPGVLEASGVCFEIIDPAHNGGRSAIVLGRASQQVASDAGEAAREGTDARREDSESATVKIAAGENGARPAWRYLYLLHAAANPPKASGAVLGVLTARYADGTGTRRELKNKTDIGNWRDPSSGENLGIAWESENATASIGLIGDRVASLVFQRFDIAPAKNAIVYAVNPGEAFESLGRLFPGGFSPLGLVARIGSLPGRPPEVLAQSAAAPLRSQAIAAAVTGGTTENLPPRAYLMDDSLAARLERDGVIPQNAIDTSRTRYASDTGQIELSADAGTVKAVSPRAELFSLAPGAALDGGCVSVADVDARCAIAVVALPASPREARDASGTPPLAAARRILVTHLTNALPQGAIFAHADCKLLKTWGGGPHLVRRGAAVLTLRLAGGDWQAWAVDAAGRRMREVPLARRAGGAFTLALSTITRGGAQLAYELAR